MINKFIFSVCASVQLQGYEVLRLVYLDKEVATYTLAGFQDHPITIQDYRPSGVESLNKLLKDGRSRDFRAGFNKPSNVLLFTGNNRDVLIQLMGTTETKPIYALCIAAGAEETVPLGHSYLFREIRELPDSGRAYLSLHKKSSYRASPPVDRRPAADAVLQEQRFEMVTSEV
jgi:hypothetical protein